MEFNSLTIIRYLLSRNDDPVKSREDYINPKAQKGTLCPYYGRSCNCASYIVLLGYFYLIYIIVDIIVDIEL